MNFKLNIFLLFFLFFFLLKKRHKGIYITFVGNAECLWNENSGDKRIAYRGKECYLSTRIYFIGEEDGMDYSEFTTHN